MGQSKIFAQAGIDFIHVVDLDGAFDGRATNRDLIAKLKKEYWTWCGSWWRYSHT